MQQFVPSLTPNRVNRHCRDETKRRARDPPSHCACRHRRPPEVLELLRRTPSVRDLLGEPLGPAAVAVRRERAAELRAALAALGLLTDGDLPGSGRP